ncbi:MAG: copper amine oxidase N-terminal domain-containing protein [Vulcanimicrobiaceae bacterium]
MFKSLHCASKTCLAFVAAFALFGAPAIAATTTTVAQAQESPPPASAPPASPAPASPAPAGTPAETAPPAPSPAPAAAPPPPDFGSPPPGEIPILFNDHHVYAKPDLLKQGRVLAALVRGGEILVPLRSMFEQMGATVSYDPASHTARVSKSGAEVVVTVGKPEVTINGESRPLDVPPIIYKNNVLVPIRVISEGMGAYVQWVPDKRLVVVRYLPATPPPPPTPPPAATPPPTPAPTPAPKRTPRNEIYLIGDYVYGGKVYNEFSPGNTIKASYNGRAGAEFNLFNLPLWLGADFRQYQYEHNQTSPTPPVGANGVIPCTVPGDQGCVTAIGGGGQTFVPAFRARENDTDFRLGVKVIDPRVYVGVGYDYRSTNYGYPKFDSFGFGIEKLPDADQPISIYASYWYYPNSRGKYTNIFGQQFTVAYTVQKYQIGGTLTAPGFPVFLDLGFLGERGNAKSESPIGYTHNGFYTGIGFTFKY